MKYVVHVQRVSLGWLEVEASSEKAALARAVKQAEKEPRAVEWVDHDFQPAVVERL